MPRHGPKNYFLEDLKALFVSSLANEEGEEEEVIT